jgi:hypothetical protein
MNTWKCSMLSASIVALSTGWAAAAPAVVLDFLNLRVGPGYDYGVIEVIAAGAIIDAGGCADGWCQVNVNGIAGYVDANYLGAARAAVIAAPPSYWSYGVSNSRYGYWSYPYRYYYGVRSDPSYAYYDEYYDGVPYPGAIAGAYAQGREAGMTVERRSSDRVRRAAVAKSNGTATSHVAKLASGSMTTAAAARPHRADQNSQ